MDKIDFPGLKADSVEAAKKSTNPIEKIDFEGLLALYRKVGKQEKIDEITIKYLDYFLPNKPEETKYQFLNGIQLSESVIRKTTENKLVTLLLNGAKPEDLIIKKILEAPQFCKFEVYDNLFKKGFITIKDLENIMLRSGFYNGVKCTHTLDNILTFLKNEDLSPYEAIDKSKIIEKLSGCLNATSYNNSSIKDFDTIIKAILRILKCFPYSENNKILINYISYFVKKVKVNDKSEEDNQISDMLKDFAKSILNGLSIEEILNLLIARPDYKSFFNIGTSLFEILNSHVDENALFDMICNGSTHHIAFALETFPNLEKKVPEIINAWIKNEMALTLDVYLDYLLSSVRATPALDIDKEYVETKTAREVQRNFTMKPTGQTINQ